MTTAGGNVTVRFDRAGVVRGRESLRRFTAAIAGGALAGLGRDADEVSILFTSDAHVAALNRDFRGIDGATDVLSFPASEDLPPPVGGYLGDLAIALGYTRDHLPAGRSLGDEVALLVVHGILHLVGHDHAEAGEKAAMWAEQDRLLAASTDLLRPQFALGDVT